MNHKTTQNKAKQKSAKTKALLLIKLAEMRWLFAFGSIRCANLFVVRDAKMNKVMKTSRQFGICA